MTPRWYVPLTAAALFLTWAATAKAQMMLSPGRRCADYEHVLKSNPGFAPVFRGTSTDGEVMEILMKPDGTWLAHFVLPDGKSCYADNGDGATVKPLPIKGASL